MGGPQDAEELRRWKFFHGYDGIPFRTQQEDTPYYKNDDPLHKRPRMVADMHVRQFDLQDAAQLRDLEQVLDSCAKGKGYISQKETHFDEKLNGWRMLLIWGTFYLEDPTEAEVRNGQDRKIFS